MCSIRHIHHQDIKNGYKERRWFPTIMRDHLNDKGHSWVQSESLLQHIRMERIFKL